MEKIRRGGDISPDFRILGPQVKPEGTGPGREAEGWKKEIREEEGEGEGEEEEMDERHVHQCLDAHSDTPTTTPDTCRGRNTGSESDRADARLSARPSEEGREGRCRGPERGMGGTGEGKRERGRRKTGRTRAAWRH